VVVLFASGGILRPDFCHSARCSSPDFQQENFFVEKYAQKSAGS
jgi:hypothetical protein